MVTLSPVGLAAAPVANQVFRSWPHLKNCVVVFLCNFYKSTVFLRLLLTGMKRLFLMELQYSCLL